MPLERATLTTTNIFLSFIERLKRAEMESRERERELRWRERIERKGQTSPVKTCLIK